MIAATEADLVTLTAHLFEVFELEEFSAEDAKDIVGEGELSRLVAAGWSYTNAIPRNSDLVPA